MKIARRNELLAKQVEAIRSENSSLRSENSTLRQGKEEDDTLSATSNSRVDELLSRVADLEVSSTQAQSHAESLEREI